MKLVFAGTPDFASVALAAIHDAGHDVVRVLTQPQRPAGRGMRLQPSAVAVLAAQRGLSVSEPPTLKDPAVQAELATLGAAVFVVAAYGLLLPPAVLAIPPRGCLNIHASLLPRWRGAAPVQRCIEAGDAETGIDIMQMDAGLDTGPVLMERRIRLEPDETSASLFGRLTTLGAQSIVDALAGLDSLIPRAQPSEGVTYARKILKTEAPIDWSLPAQDIERRIRAFDPFPGCETRVGELRLKIWRAQVEADAQGAEPGVVLRADGRGIVVGTGHNTLCVTDVQAPGGKRMAVRDFLRGHPIGPGTRLA